MENTNTTTAARKSGIFNIPNAWGMGYDLIALAPGVWRFVDRVGRWNTIALPLLDSRLGYIPTPDQILRAVRSREVA